MQQFIVEPKHQGNLSWLFPNSAPIFKPGGSGTINVKDDYMWTLQKNGESRRDVPALYMREQMVIISSALQNFRYNVGNASPLLVGAGAGNLLQRLAASASGAISIKNQLVALGGGIAAGAIAENILRLDSVNNLNGTGSSKKYLRPYGGLYATGDTGFKYILPYLEKEQIDQLQTQWGDGAAFKGYSSKKNTVGWLADTFNDISNINEKFSSILSNIAGAAYVEKPKTYQYGTENSSITIQLYLFNTVEWKHTVNNFEFITLLFYQNLPNRLSTIVLDPPVIYEAYVPGSFYFPYCFINNLQVNSIGASRSIDMPLWVSTDIMGQETPRTLGNHQGGVDRVNIPVIVPDVYEVKFTLQSLVPKSKNLKFQSLMSGINDTGFSVNIRNQ